MSGHPEPTTSDGDTASRSERLFGKSRLSLGIFRENPRIGSRIVSDLKILLDHAKVFSNVVPGVLRCGFELRELFLKT